MPYSDSHSPTQSNTTTVAQSPSESNNVQDEQQPLPIQNQSLFQDGLEETSSITQGSGSREKSPTSLEKPEPSDDSASGVNHDHKDNILTSSPSSSIERKLSLEGAVRPVEALAGLDSMNISGLQKEGIPTAADQNDTVTRPSLISTTFGHFADNDDASKRKALAEGAHQQGELMLDIAGYKMERDTVQDTEEDGMSDGLKTPPNLEYEKLNPRLDKADQHASHAPIQDTGKDYVFSK